MKIKNNACSALYSMRKKDQLLLPTQFSVLLKSFLFFLVTKQGMQGHDQKKINKKGKKVSNQKDRERPNGKQDEFQHILSFSQS